MRFGSVGLTAIEWKSFVVIWDSSPPAPEPDAALLASSPGSDPPPDEASRIPRTMATARMAMPPAASQGHDIELLAVRCGLRRARRSALVAVRARLVLMTRPGKAWPTRGT